MKKIRTLLFLIVLCYLGTSQADVSPSADVVPAVPENGLTTSDATRIRDELMLLRADTEQKITRLEDAKKNYDAAKKDIEEKLAQVAEEKRLLNETLQKEKQIQETKIADSVGFFSKMDPRKAAPMMETMDRDLVIALMAKMPSKQVTSVLENMTPAKATQYLEYYTHIRSGREFEMLRDLGLCNGNKEPSDDKPDPPAP